MRTLIVLILLSAGLALAAKKSGDTCFVRADHVFHLVNDACTVVNGKVSNCVSARVTCDDS